MKRFNLKDLRVQAGVTILEFIAFIGLAALVIAGALGLYNSAGQGAATGDLVQTTNGIVATLRQTYATSNVTDWAAAANNTSAPNGWSPFAGGETSKSGRSITISGNGNMTVKVDAGDAKTCDQIKQSAVGGVRGSACSGNTVTFSGIKP